MSVLSTRIRSKRTIAAGIFKHLGKQKIPGSGAFGSGLRRMFRDAHQRCLASFELANHNTTMCNMMHKFASLIGQIKCCDPR